MPDTNLQLHLYQREIWDIVQQGITFKSIRVGDFSSFLDSSDTPSSYSGEGLNVLRVNAGETAIEFVDVAALDSKVGVDSSATPDYMGASAGAGVLRTSSPITYADGGDYVTLGIDDGAIDHDALTNTHNLTTDIDHNQLTNYEADEHFTEASIDHTNILNIGSNTHTDIDGHISSTANPHSVTDVQAFAVSRNFVNGSFAESFDFRTTSALGVVTGDLEQSGTGDLTMQFSDGDTVLDCTPAQTIALTVGTDTVPVTNYVYIPQSTKILTVSTSEWFVGEHIRVAQIALQSAATTATDGALRNQNWNDHLMGTDDQGHMLHIAAKLRNFEAQWDSGVELTIAGDPAATGITIATTSGSIFQMHPQTFVAKNTATGDDVNVANDSVTPFDSVTDITDITADAVGDPLNNTSFSLVVWGVINKTGEESHLMLNLPTGTYSKNFPEQAMVDAGAKSVFTIPKQFAGVGFLIARLTFANSGGTWTLYQNEDLRGSIPNTTSGGSTGGGGVTSYLGLTDTPSTYVGETLKIPQINAGETALEFTNAPTILGTNFTAIDADDVNIADAGTIITATEVEGALQENRTAINLNTAKATNVTTNLSLGAVDATTMVVASSDGTDATLIEADTDDAGLLGAGKFDEIVANSLKVTNATHSSEVTGDTALTIADNVVDEANLKVNAPSNDDVLTADDGEAGGMKWASVPSGFADPMTTRGDIIYRDATNTTNRLAIGANGTAPLSDGTDLAYGAITPADGWISANESWAYASTTTFTNSNTTYGCTITVPTDATTKYSAGMKVRFTQATGGVKYGIITYVAATVLTVFLGEDYTLVNEAITVPFYSTMKAPFGFPMSPNIWRVYVTDTANRSQASPTAGTWYNINSQQLNIPNGSWKTAYHESLQINRGTSGTTTVLSSLSTSASAESSGTFTNYFIGTLCTGTCLYSSREGVLAFSGSSGDIYYLVHKTLSAGMSSIQIRGDQSDTYIEARLTYL